MTGPLNRSPTRRKERTFSTSAGHYDFAFCADAILQKFYWSLEHNHFAVLKLRSLLQVLAYLIYKPKMLYCLRASCHCPSERRVRLRVPGRNSISFDSCVASSPILFAYIPFWFLYKCPKVSRQILKNLYN